jgi:hypothetical protein
MEAVCEYLSVRGYVFWRQNNTGIYDKNIGGFRAMPKYSVKGVADIQAIVDGKSWFLECKANTKQSEDQYEFELMVKRAGAEYHVIHSIDELQALGF